MQLCGYGGRGRPALQCHKSAARTGDRERPLALPRLRAGVGVRIRWSCHRHAKSGGSAIPATC